MGWVALGSQRSRKYDMGWDEDLDGELKVDCSETELLMIVSDHLCTFNFGSIAPNCSTLLV